MMLSGKQQIAVGITLGLAAVLALGFLLVRGKMQHDFWEITSLAQLSYQQTDEPVESLLVWIQSPQHTLQERNRGVWALGQFRDERALPTLEKYYHGGECDHENELCQQELEKAIKLIKGEGRSLFRLKKP
jgi:hypothetical protein